MRVPETRPGQCHLQLQWLDVDFLSLSADGSNILTDLRISTDDAGQCMRVSQALEAGTVSVISF